MRLAFVLRELEEAKRAVHVDVMRGDRRELGPRGQHRGEVEDKVHLEVLIVAKRIGNFSISKFSPLPCESLTTISVAPAAKAASIAEFTSCVMNSRNRWYSNPCGLSWSPVTTPVIPSMSAEI